jgi:hypothetical protein
MGYPRTRSKKQSGRARESRLPRTPALQDQTLPILALEFSVLRHPRLGALQPAARQCVSGQFKSGAVVSNAMSGFVKAYVKFDQLKPHIDNACKAIKDYMAIFIFEDGRIGSGTFVRTGGLSGLLTAWHVAEHLSSFQEFVLCATDSPHRLSISSDLMDHVPIGVVPQGSMPEEGPDLSFLIIRDEGLLEKLRTIKSFYPLDSSRSPCIHPLLNQKIWWGVAGSPGESLKRSHENYQGGPLTRLLNFVGADRFPFQMFEKRRFRLFATDGFVRARPISKGLRWHEWRRVLDVTNGN